MAVCDVNAVLPPLEGVVPWAQSGVKLSPAMQQWAASFAYDLNVPVGSIHRKWFDGVPVVARVECHRYTVKPDGSTVSGAYHGVTLYYATSPTMFPVESASSPHSKSFFAEYTMISLALFGTAFTVATALFKSKHYKKHIEEKHRKQIQNSLRR